MRRVQMTIRGRVQGVCFRAFTRKQATLIGVTGWVKNQPDGTVLLVAEGHSEQIEALRMWCNSGPPSAHVDTVDAIWDKGTGEFENFEIRY